jgi:hypothetical protein
MFGKVTTELTVTVKAGTNSDKYKDKKALQKFLQEKLVEFEIEVNSKNTDMRVHLEPYEGCGCQ